MANTKITNPELFNLGDSTSATQLPVMTTTQRIAMVPTTSASSFNIDYLVVAGGGAGGGWYRGGGGGAGELKESASSVALSTGSSYVVTIGAGGIGVGVSSDNGSNGNNGSNSTFYNITSLGGGGGSPGDSSSGNTGSDGGSGGGAGGNWGGAAANGGSATGTGLGNNGGVGGPGSSVWQCGGGGGGATQAGFNAGTSGTAGDGGAGKTYTAATSITGQAFSIAGGGGGANYSSGNITVGGIGGGAAGASGTTPYTSGPSAANNTGGGGGGGNGVPASSSGAGGNGGSGIVILRYATAGVSSYTTTGITPTETTDGTDTILSFTTVGTGTINFTGALIPGTPPMTDGEMIFNSTTDKVEYWDGTKWYGITYEAPVPLAFNEMWYSVDSPYNCASNRGTITNAIADFNTYTEGQADYNTSPRTSGKWYIEILQRQSTGHNGYTVFQKSGNTTYNTAPYVSTNPVDANYGLTLYANGNICYYGDGSTLTALSPTPNLGISNNQVACIAVDVDNQKVWFGKKTSATATSVTWVSGTNPATNTGGYSVGFTEFDPMVSHASETSSRESEFGLVDVANFATPSGFSNWQGNISSSLTVNCSQH